MTDKSASSKEVTAYIKDWIERENAGGKPYAELAKLIGVSKTQVQNVRGGTRGAGPDMELGFARRFHAGSVDELRRLAHEFCRQKFPAPVIEDDPLPRRAAALRRLHGLLREETIRRVRSMRYPNGPAMSEFDWIWTAIQEQLAVERDALIEPESKK